jgi:ADP-ribose pyrophosphatase
VRHPGSIVVLAIDSSKDEPRVLLEKQYRYAADQFLYELPAGRIDPGEKKLAAAKRELIEETGYRAKKWSFAFRFWASPGFVDESMDLFVAEQLTLGEAQPEEDEKIEISLVPLKQAVKMVMDGTIRDGKTMVGVLWYSELLRTSKTPRRRTRGK